MFASTLRTIARFPSSKILRCEIVSLNTSSSLNSVSSTPTMSDLSVIPVQYGVGREAWVENLDSRYIVSLSDLF